MQSGPPTSAASYDARLAGACLCGERITTTAPSERHERGAGGAGPHPALRRAVAVDGGAILAILAEALEGWDALASDLAAAAALPAAPAAAAHCSATQARPLPPTSRNHWPRPLSRTLRL